MTNEIIKAEDYGLEATKANELTAGLKVVRAERELLIKEFEEVSELELSEENSPRFKELRLKIVKNRTQGINTWHKANKEFFLTGGKFVDAIKNRETDINERMEEKLMDAEKHFENLEKQRIEKLQSQRVGLLIKYVDAANEMDLANMEEDVWNSYLATKKQAHLDFIEAEKKREQERLDKIEADRLEQERIIKENAKLKKEAEAKAKQDKIEADKRAKIEADRIAKEEVERKEREQLAKIESDKREAILQKERDEKEKLEAELKAKEEAVRIANEVIEKAKQIELNKGDADKVKDLISDLNNLKIKYAFKSAKNKKMYLDVGMLIDKVTNYINK